MDCDSLQNISKQEIMKIFFLLFETKTLFSPKKALNGFKLTENTTASFD